MEQLEKLEEATGSEKREKLLDSKKLNYEEKLLYCFVCAFIQMMVLVLAFFSTRDIHQQVVLNGACENAMAKACPRENDFCASMPTSTSKSN